MIKIVINILLIIFVFSVSIVQTKEGDMTPLIFDSGNILQQDQIDMAIDNNTVNFTVVKYRNILYIDSDFFATYFKFSPEQIKGYAPYGGILKAGNKNIICLSLFSLLNNLGVRYTYNPIYSKDIIRIRTDKNFSVDPNYVYKPSDTASKGNNPVSTDKYPNNTYLNIGYPNIYYPYNYYYPPGYRPGYYFGSYGFIPQVPNIITHDPIFVPQGPIIAPHKP